MNGNKDFRLGVSEIPKPLHLAATDLRSASGMLTRSHQNRAVTEINQPENPPSPSNALLTWFPLSCLVIYAVVSTILIYHDKVIHYLKRSWVSQPKIPCSTCRFFNDNYYLKCAVRPGAALTQDAINCSDYYPCKDVSEQELFN